MTVATPISPAARGFPWPALIIGLLLIASIGSTLYARFGASPWAPPPVARSEAETVLGPIAPDVLIGETQGVTGAFVANAGYVVTNPTQPRATYTAFGPLPGGAGDFRIEARVRLSNTQAPNEGVGVVFARDPQNGRAYMAAAIMGDGSVSVFQNGPDGLNQMMTSKTEGMIKPEVNVLEVIREKGEVSITVNGKSVSSHSGTYIATSTEAGIFANGLGVFTFEKVTPQGRPAKT
jgi:hypothetical protein